MSKIVWKFRFFDLKYPKLTKYWRGRGSSFHIFTRPTVTALSRNIHHINHGGIQMRQSRNTQHLNGVPFLQRFVQNTWSVNHLPWNVLVIEVTNIQTLGGKRVWLNLDIGSAQFVHETGFSDVWESAKDQGPGVWIDGRKS